MPEMLNPQTLFTAQNGIALLTLAALEIVLGIDNIVFISILTGKLPPERRPMARRIGLGLALVARIALLLTITWIMKLTAPLIHIPTFGLIDPPAAEGAHTGHPVSGKDLILLLGGLFLMLKAVKEIHHKVEGGETAAGTHPDPARGFAKVSFNAILAQIILIDIVFSLDSVITAVGMAQSIPVMIAAVIIAVGVMLALAAPISGFVERHPTIKMLALAFLLLIGVTLIAESFHLKIPKGYIYFAMAFSLLVEMLNIRVSRKYARAPGPA
ncbi:MAG: TerC family protein [Phycisphaerales bacterium]|nr:TerC family protein [Phycisphaerales bacterium]